MDRGRQFRIFLMLATVSHLCKYITNYLSNQTFLLETLFYDPATCVGLLEDWQICINVNGYLPHNGSNPISMTLHIFSLIDANE